MKKPTVAELADEVRLSVPPAPGNLTEQDTERVTKRVFAALLACEKNPGDAATPAEWRELAFNLAMFAKMAGTFGGRAIDAIGREKFDKIEV